MQFKHLRASLAVVACVASSAFAQDVLFDINRFQVEGNSLLPVERVQHLVAPFTGKKRNYGDVQKALEALEGEYRKVGYGTVQVYVPEQELAAGVVRLVVTESVIGKIDITGNKHVDINNIRASLPDLAEGKTPNMRKLSENIQLANENPSKQMEVTLGVSEEEGKVDAKVKVTDESASRLIATLDNTGTDNTGRHRLGLAYQHANLFNRDHVLTLAYTGAPDMPAGRRVSVYSAAYRLPLYSIGDAIDFAYGKSDVNTPIAQATGLNIVGRGEVVALRWNHYLARSGEYNAKLIFGLDDKKIDTCIGAICTPSTIRPFSLAYAGQKQSSGQAIDYNLSVASANKIRGAGVTDFTAYRLNANWLQAMPQEWAMRLAFQGQYSARAVPSAEQFGVAGSGAVRGFFERMVIGDTGYVTNVEVYTPELIKHVAPLTGSLKFLAFVDQGRGSTYIAGGTRDTDIASVGLGLRYALDKRVALRADVAYVTKAGRTDLLAPTTDTNVRKDDYRGHFALQVTY